jgi:hypothetical protein
MNSLSNHKSQSYLRGNLRRTKLMELRGRNRRSQGNQGKARKLRKVAMDNKMALMSYMEIKISKTNQRKSERRRIQPSRV